MKTIILICNYNEERTKNLKNTLQAVKNNKLENTLIGIIDNASKDKSKELITQYAQLFDVIIFNKKNIGKAKALNKLLQYFIATYQININEDIIISLDSDIIMCKDFIKISEQVFATYPECILFTTYGKSCITDNNIDNCHAILPIALTKINNNLSKINKFMGVCRLHYCNQII